MKNTYVIIGLFLFLTMHVIAQNDHLITNYGEPTRRNYIKALYNELYEDIDSKSIYQNIDSVYSFFKEIDIIYHLTQQYEISICNHPLHPSKLVDGKTNMFGALMQRIDFLENYGKIKEKSFAEMSYVVLDTIIYDKPFTSWDTERISKLYREKIKQKKRKERKKFNLSFIDCQEPLMDYSTNKFHKKNIYQFTPPIFDCDYRTAMIFVKKEGDGFSILFFRRSQNENNIWQPWEFVYYYNLYGFSHEIYTKEWYKK